MIRFNKEWLTIVRSFEKQLSEFLEMFPRRGAEKRLAGVVLGLLGVKRMYRIVHLPDPWPF